MTYEELLRENKIQKLQIAELQSQLDQLKRIIFGKSSERYIPADNGQLDLFTNESTTAKKQDTPEEVIVPQHTKKKTKHRGRTLIANHAHLAVEEIEIEVEHSAESEHIGTVHRHTLAYKPGKFFIKKEAIKKYKEPETGKITAAVFPAHPIPKCEADISLLTHISVSKYVDHLPEYRQQQIFRREHVVIPPSTMNGWVHQVAGLLRPMADHIEKQIMASGNIMVDESSIRVMTAKKNRTHIGWMWVVYSPALKHVRFMYHQGRNREIPITMLKDFKGRYQTDGYEAYDSLDKVNAQAEHSHCNAHARRYFEKALSNDQSRANHALKVYQKLYEKEKYLRTHRTTNPKQEISQYYDYRKKQRQNLRPILDEYKRWLEVQSLEVLPRSAIGKAIAYTLKRWKKLTKYLSDGALEIDNNLIENAIRPLALGRKNYLFAGNHEAAQNNAVFQTIFGTCRHLEIDPTDYLNWYLSQIPTTNINQIQSLSPKAYKLFSQQE